MRKRLLSTTLLLAGLHVGAACASVLGNDTCQTLVAEGRTLYNQGKVQEAWAAFQRARQADPAASQPLASMGNLLLIVSTQAPADKAPELRKQAEALTRQALQMEAQDPLAQETLRLLVDEQPVPLHAPSVAAAQAEAEGEALFFQRRYDEALAKYELAAQRDPQFSAAWVNAGDCFYSRKQWHEAELRFAKAAEIEPLNGQAWRFLADALMMQHERVRAEAALFGGIAAQPSQLPNWDKLELVMKQDGMTLKRLALMRRARFVPAGADGKPTIEVVEKGMEQTPELAFWLLHAGSVANAMKAGGATPFRVELDAWREALKMVSEMRAKGQPVPTDPALVTMAKLADAGQLEPAILLLMYREAYRPEFEAWKKAHPDGIKAFVVSTGLRP
jgi:tetratricopeptide (TPR) repeat protein